MEEQMLEAEPVDEVEVGRRVADAEAATDRALAAGAELIRRPTETPWRSLNSRLNGVGGRHFPTT